MHTIVMPRVDPAMQSGTLLQWLKKEGDAVKLGEAVAVAEGEKTSFEITSPRSGILRKILKDVGNEITVSEPIALVGELSEAIPSEVPTAAFETKAASEPTRPHPVEEAGKAGPVTPRASPAARKLASDYGIDLTKVHGTGPGSRITREDIQRAQSSLATGAGQPVSAMPSVGRTPRVMRQVLLSGTRKTIAERMAFSAENYPTATLIVEADLSRLMQSRRELEKAGAWSSITSFLVKAAALALGERRILNSSLEGGLIRTYEEINVAVAVDAPDGLVAPVIASADKLSVAEISKTLDDLSAKAKSHSLTVQDLTGSTFTVSNLGGFGVDTFVPLINPPNAAILGVGKVTSRPAFVEGNLIGRETATLTLVFDHRIADGVQAAGFLDSLKAHLEHPDTLLQ